MVIHYPADDDDSSDDQPVQSASTVNSLSAPDDLNSSKALAQRRSIERRRELVTQMMLKGYTRDRIAEELEVSATTVHYDMQAIKKEWRAQAIENVQEQALLDLARLDFIISGQIDRAPFDKTAADTVLRAISERASILGYKQGMTFDVESYIKQLAEQNGYPVERAIEIAQRVKLSFKTG